MWIYQKKLEYPVNITTPNPRMAKALMAQYGGPDSELAAGCRYLTQRFSMPDNRVKATCNDIGTEEIAHWEMIGTMIHQCLRDATLKDIEAAGLMGYYTMHSKGVYPADPNGVPFTAAYLQCTGDPIADITEDMAADAAMSKRQHFAQIMIPRQSRGYFLNGQSPMLPATPHAALVRSDICMGLLPAARKRA